MSEQTSNQPKKKPGPRAVKAPAWSRGLDTTTRTLVGSQTATIRGHLLTLVKTARSIGIGFLEVKKALKRGPFARWLKDEVALSDDTAQRYMNIALRYKDAPIGATIGVRALYLLSAPSSPQEALQEAVDLAESGEALDEEGQFGSDEGVLSPDSAGPMVLEAQKAMGSGQEPARGLPTPSAPGQSNLDQRWAPEYADLESCLNALDYLLDTGRDTTPPPYVVARLRRLAERITDVIG